ncbi:MAG: cobalamin B12-binding domain-containing protein [Candidatus Rokubacteria bacterium]|nr:cobalamin B12-binding domain-containing protein [Candidatus Rokubacteria bacterium]
MSEQTTQRIKVLIAKVGLDGHERGAKVVVHALKNAGMEVVYTGLHQTPEEVARAAMQEDVDVVGLSVLSGAHVVLAQAVAQQLRERGMEDVLLMIGGTILQRDVPALRAAGFQGVFGVGSTLGEIVAFVRSGTQHPAVS